MKCQHIGGVGSQFSDFGEVDFVEVGFAMGTRWKSSGHIGDGITVVCDFSKTVCKPSLRGL